MQKTHQDSLQKKLNPRKTQRSIAASVDDLKLLIAKRYVIAFENGVIAIKHWRMHNTLRKDRYTPTAYQEQFAMLEIKTNGVYTEKKEPDIHTAATRQPDGNHTATQYSIGEISIDEISIEREENISTGSPTLTEYITLGKFKNVLLTSEELQALKTEYSDYKAKIDNLSLYMQSTGKTYDSHYATIIKWAKEDAKKPKGRKELVPEWMNRDKKNYFQDYDAKGEEVSDLEKQILQDRVRNLKEKLGTA